MVILDTDHMSVLERRAQPGVSNLLARLAEVPPSVVPDDGDQLRGTDAGLDGLSCPGAIYGTTDHGLQPTTFAS